MANFAYIQITRECNRECLFCSNPPSGWKDMPLSKAKKIVDDYCKGIPEAYIDLYGDSEFIAIKSISAA
jgi:radical SAM superfamily enzyme YgiQ (UPF0313 family)